MGKALYRKYRSRRLAEIVGQEHITSTLSKALAAGRISHAYLFTGPRGVGKTSIARILAHELNELPYSDDEGTHLDIIEIDAASNRRIDEIRELREHIHSAPTVGKYKVYIIDEVHMLTKEAFNALLKTLEEPPAHVIFILATTEAHKLPDTIVSRTQRFTFRPIAKDAVVDHLREIAKSESITVTDDALSLVARAGGGSFRDSISLLDQLGASGDLVDEALVRRTLGIVPEESIKELITSLEHSQSELVMQSIRALRDNGYQAAQIARQLLSQLREQLLAKQVSDPFRTHSLLESLLSVPAAHDPETKLDLVLIGYTIDPQASITYRVPAPMTVTAPAATPQPTPQPTAPAPEPKPAKQAAAQEPAAPRATQPEPEQAPAPQAEPEPESAVADTPPPAPATYSQEPEVIWQALLDALRAKYNTLYGIARMARPEFAGNSLTLHFGFAFHQKRMNEPKNKQILLDAAQVITGTPWSIHCVLTKKDDLPEQLPAASAPSPAPAAQAEPATPAPSAQPTPSVAAGTDPLATISNVFGSAEVLDA